MNQFLAVLLVSMAIATPAVAAEDSGSRSVFARGAGNRALALGGAYSAVSNDVTALMWNPAGLGLMEKNEFQMSQTSYFGVDVSEQFGAVAFPSWRWGTAGIVYRHLGVSGIEGRDDRNALVSSDLATDESELSLGYGREIGQAWSVGATLKLQRQSIADFKDSGLGMDIGVIVKPFVALNPASRSGRNVSVGLSVRNAVQPSIRLLQQSVEDPTVIRLGTAYQFRGPKNWDLLTAFDIEHTKDMDIRLHAGLEARAYSALALRAGFNQSVFTTGAGVTWHGMTVDYTMESSELDNVHRIGASFSFGSSVNERRFLARQAHEDEIQSRVAGEFDRRQADRISTLLDDARQAREEGRIEEALEALAVIGALEPGRSDISYEQAECLVDLAKKNESASDYATAIVNYSRALSVSPDHLEAAAGLERCTKESDRLAARSQAIRVQFAAALDAFSVRDFTGAKTGFEGILRVRPDDTEARDMLDRTVRAIDARVVDLSDQATRLIVLEQFDEASDLADEIRSLKPNASQLPELESRLQRAKSTVEHAAPPTHDQPATTGGVVDMPVSAVVSAEQRSSIPDLYRLGMEAMSDNRRADAIKYLELVWSIDPTYERVADNLKDECLRGGLEFFANADLDQAIKLWEKALHIDPDDTKAKGYLARAREHKARAREILGSE